MAIQALNERLGSEHGTDAPLSDSSALVFVLNRPFLWPFKVLLYSLAKSGSLVSLPVLVLSEDDSLQDEPIVKLIADRFIHVDQARLAAFARISGEHVHQSLKIDWIAKYTLLKWLVFENYGFDRHIYLDCDLVCINDANGLDDLGDADVYVGPLFNPSLISDASKQPHHPDQRKLNIESFLAQDSYEKLNSGVMVLGSRALDGRFRQDLIDTAESVEKFRTEQQIIRKVLTENGSYEFDWLSPSYNFHWSYLAALPVHRQCEMLSQISLLHFVGSSNKPWQIAKTPPNRWVPHALWREFAAEAAEADSILGKPE